jgi:Zn-dependent protease with chaperone function
MRKYILSLLSLVVCSLLSSQQAPSISTAALPSADSVQVPSGPGQGFAFTKIDNDLFDEANAVDALYEKKGLVMHDPVLQAFLDSVGKRVLANRPIPENVTFRFRALRDPMVNAFALPNGSVYVTTGLLALLENEAQLAGVLGHETSHVFERHSYLQNRSIRKKTLAIEIIAAAANWVPGGYTYGLVAAAAADVNTLILVETVYGYSRELETQADSDGIAAMVAAGYNPHAMAVTFKLLDQDRTLDYEPNPTFYHDHPKLQEREAVAVDYAEHHTPPGAQTGSEQDYLTALAPAIASSVDADIESRRPRAAVARATRLVNAFPGDSNYEMLLGESYRELGAKTTEPTPDELTQEGENRQRKQVLKMTEEQEQHKLLSTPEGRATLQQNQAAAEKLSSPSFRTIPITRLPIASSVSSTKTSRATPTPRQTISTLSSCWHPLASTVCASSAAWPQSRAARPRSRIDDRWRDINPVFRPKDRFRCKLFPERGNLMIFERRMFLAIAAAMLLTASASTAFASSFYVQHKVVSRQFPIGPPASCRLRPSSRSWE